MAEEPTFHAYAILVDGEAAGIAVRVEHGFRFYASSNEFLPLERRIFRLPDDAQRAAEQHAHERLRSRSEKYLAEIPRNFELQAL